MHPRTILAEIKKGKQKMAGYISEEQISKQSWKYYFVLFAWPVFLFTLPAVISKFGIFSLIYMIFPGIFLFTWTAYLMHESWHKYVKYVPNGFFYNIFALMLLMDPQIYSLLHGFHHSLVNTWDDTEFHPFGDIKNRKLKILYNILEIFFGMFFIFIISLFVVPNHKRYKTKYRYLEAIISFSVICAFLLSIGILSSLAFRVTITQIALSFLVMYFIGSLVIHHSQMVEHGNLIAEGPWEERNVFTRNLKHKVFLNRAFLFFTHNDSREHVLHHTLTTIYSRPFPEKIPMPKESVFIGLSDYLKILGEMLKGETIVQNSLSNSNTEE